MDIDEPADDRRINGVIAAVHAHEVVAAQSDPIDPPESRDHRPQGRTSPPDPYRANRPNEPWSCAPSARSLGLAGRRAGGLKSAGDENARPGIKEVSKHPLRRSTTPLDSES